MASAILVHQITTSRNNPLLVQSQPPLALVDFMHLGEGLVDVWNSRYERGSALNRPPPCFPVERVSPAEIVIVWAACLLKYLKKMNRSLITLLFAKGLCEQCKAHRIVCVCDW